MDEREKLHEAISERNSTWTMVSLLCLAAIYKAMTAQSIDSWILITLFGGLVAKAITNYYLAKNN